jgi:hypothetical protein
MYSISFRSLFFVFLLLEKYKMTEVYANVSSCSYDEKLRVSVGPGMYKLTTPANDENACGRDIPADPSLRWQSWGPGFCAPGANIDDNSELKGMNYLSSKCDKDMYNPYNYKVKPACIAEGNQDAHACTAPMENTRLSNPPCTLRSTGWNRWEWLCWNPQDRAIIPFQWNVNSSIVTKNNHTPCLPQFLDQVPLFPTASLQDDNQPFIRSWKMNPSACGTMPPVRPGAPAQQTCLNIGQL